MPRTVVLMGPCGSGKTRIGELYVTMRKGTTFIDGDDYHPESNISKMAAGIPLTDDDRAGWLVAIASRILKGKEKGESMVVCCSALKRVYRDVLRSRGDPDTFFVFLEGTKDILLERLRGRSNHFMSSALLDSQLSILEPPDQGIEPLSAIVSIDQSPESIVDEILSKL